MRRSDCVTCPAGYYCVQASTTSGVQCPAGYYCPQGTQSVHQVNNKPIK